MSAAALEIDTITTEMSSLRALALALTHSSSDADDLLQDSLLRAWRFRNSFDPSRGDAKCWMKTIVRNTHANRCASTDSQNRSRDGLAIVVAISDSMHSCPEAAVLRSEHESEIRAVVHAAIDALPSEQAVAVRMCDIEGLSYAEIARRTGVPMGTVMSRIHRGRRRMEAMLGK